MYVCVFMALIATTVLCARSQDLVMSVSVRRVHVVLSTLLDLRAEESRVVRHVKPPRYGESSRRPRALSRVRTQAIGALAQGSYPLSYPSALGIPLKTLHISLTTLVISIFKKQVVVPVPKDNNDPNGLVIIQL